MRALLATLKKDNPDLSFVAGSEFYWSPKNHEVIYDQSATTQSASWSLLHEVGHALLGHTTYQTDIELLQMEAAAWQKATQMGKKYGYEIDQDHIEDCLDTYRDWLHQRSACPTCNNRSLQQSDGHYKCFNCGTDWAVSQSRFCRPYRMVKKAKTPPSNQRATFA